MSHHKISADGQTIECTAPPEADCRRRPGPECDHEVWPCGHELLPGQDCWKVEWTNAVGMLDDTYDGPGAPITIYPGKAVDLEWDSFNESVLWRYA